MKRFVYLSLLMIFANFLTACSNNTEQNEEEINKVEDTVNIPTETVYQFSHNGQEFQIISFFDEMLEYARTISENPELDKKAIYTEIILEPFKDKSSLDSVTLGITKTDPFIPTSQVEQLEKNINELLKNQEQINQWIEEAILESAELLSSGANTSIFLIPVNPEDSYTTHIMGGMRGFAFFKNNILLMIDPTASKEVIKYTVSHEYHHTVNDALNGEQAIYSVLDRIITEGKADSFASILYPEVNPPWTEDLPEDAEDSILEELKINGNSTDNKIYIHFEFGNPRKNLPKWSNYKIGYQITESFIENNPESSILEWAKLDAKQIVKGSKYSDLFQ